MQGSSGGQDPFGGDPFAWTPPVTSASVPASGTALQRHANETGFADEDVFDLFGPAPATSKQNLPPTPTSRLSNGSETQPSTSRPSKSAPLAVPDPFGNALMSGHGKVQHAESSSALVPYYVQNTAIACEAGTCLILFALPLLLMHPCY